MWQDLGAALCLLLVLEGIAPFLSPRGWKAAVARLTTVDDQTLRMLGLASMLIGTGLLYLITQR